MPAIATPFLSRISTARQIAAIWYRSGRPPSPICCRRRPWPRHGVGEWIVRSGDRRAAEIVVGGGWTHPTRRRDGGRDGASCDIWWHVDDEPRADRAGPRGHARGRQH